MRAYPLKKGERVLVRKPVYSLGRLHINWAAATVVEPSTLKNVLVQFDAGGRETVELRHVRRV